VFVLYAGYRYGWDERAVGLAMALVGICAVIVQAGLVRVFTRQFGERRSLMIGLLFGALGFAVYGVAPTGTLFCFGIPLMALWGLASPTVNGLMSKRVGASEQGVLQGANGSIQGLANMVGPSIFAITFSVAIGGARDWNLPGAPFLLGAAMLTASAALAWRVTRPQ
jgi:DHA1 family tetracycline resistance protein-like MFS transporter